MSAKMGLKNDAPNVPLWGFGGTHQSSLEEIGTVANYYHRSGKITDTIFVTEQVTAGPFVLGEGRAAREGQAPH